MCDEKNGHKRCQHGMCLNHQPDWEDVGKPEYRPNPTFFGIKVYLSVRCCGRRMLRMLSIQKKRCKTCGREGSFPDAVIALCSCCGQKVNKTSYSLT